MNLFTNQQIEKNSMKDIMKLEKVESIKYDPPRIDVIETNEIMLKLGYSISCSAFKSGRE